MDASREGPTLDEVVERLKLALDCLPIGCVITGPDFRYVYWNPAAEVIFGFSRAEVLGKHPFETIVPPTSEAAAKQIFDRISAGDMDATGDGVNVTREGREITCRWTNTPLFDSSGTFIGCLSTVQDLTERERERKRLEEELLQAQKLESVGRLAGGIAHDFNNVLTAIVGYTELARTTLEESHPVQGDLREIDRAAGRATRLTQQLLAFARRQMVEPRLIDLSSLVLGLHQMLSRTVGEDIKLVTVLGPGLWPVRADTGQIEQVLLNLVVNARDAMPSGGRLTIETENVVTDGGEEHVRLSVSDTGIGMTPEVQARMFEPFFTTKEPGKGTGLGLATCYGIVTQAGGKISAESEPGRGTTFRIDLPRATGTLPAEVEPARAEDAAPRGKETVLLVEDEDLVRSVAARALRESGYQVIEAPGPVEALHASAGHAAPIPLLVTDVVMPQMNGRELAERLSRARPDLKVLYLTGYADGEVVRQGVVDPSIKLLRKPFTPKALARAVREVLDS